MDTPPATLPQSQNRRLNTGSKPRTPLQERTQSQTNEDSGRLGREGKYVPGDIDMFSANPFPTKPQHVLLPSTVRKQRSFRDGENEMQSLFVRNQQGAGSRPTTAGQSEPSSDESRSRRQPVLQLKRSVTTLRDMYEAQSEKSRPSTAASFAQRPGTASSRLRSASSSEGMSGRNAWERLQKVSADDMALLPTLSRSSLEKLASESSFATRAEQTNFLTSTPNYRTYGSSSPNMPVFRDVPSSISEEYHQSSSSGMPPTSSSSPNFVRLGRSSSIVETLNTEQSSSSPNFVKLGTSSPGYRHGGSPTPSVASTGSRKRKRTNIEEGATSATRSHPFASSPPYAELAASSPGQSSMSQDRVMPSSPPQPESVHSRSIGDSSPVYRLPGRPRDASDSSSSSSAHANLQTALSSSPMAPIQYPVVRAPAPVAYSLNVHKRIIRNSSNENWTSRLSPVPSEWDEGPSRSASKRSRIAEDEEDDFQRSDSVTAEPTGNESQVHIVPVKQDDHEHEATDELRALPRRGLAYRTPPLVPVRTNSLFGTTSSSSNSRSQSRLDSLRNSVDTRLNSMKSFAHSRQNSFVSSNARPNSSTSQSPSVVLPTWARRYYSGLYRDSFQYLYPSQTNSASQLPIPMNYSLQRSTSVASIRDSQGPGASASEYNRRRSWQSIRRSLRSSMLGFVPSVLLPKDGARLEARKSHLTTGIGPLVSNPVSPEMVHGRTSPFRTHSTIRPVVDQLPAADPRAHWAGITDEQISAGPYTGSTPYHSSQQVHRQSADSDSVYYDAISGQMMVRSRFTDMPHLHHDRRLNTGSSKSRGFGAPFNQKSKYNGSPVYDGANQPSWFRVDLRDAQVICFIAGFACPLVWFVGAFLPLPKRPQSFEDIEKAMYEQQPEQAGEWQDLDVVARLRLERHIKGIEELKWQNARWWKRMNKWMCMVGVVVCMLVVVLAVIGTKNNW